jgi:hypothetical protein
LREYLNKKFYKQELDLSHKKAQSALVKISDEQKQYAYLNTRSFAERSRYAAPRFKVIRPKTALAGLELLGPGHTDLEPSKCTISFTRQIPRKVLFPVKDSQQLET